MSKIDMVTIIHRLKDVIHEHKLVTLIVVSSVCTLIIVSIILIMIIMASSPHAPNDDSSTSIDDTLSRSIDWSYWKSINPDIIGWVTVPGTDIDQPIVQAHANAPRYYLSHDVYRHWNLAGCPYLAAECEGEGFDSLNAVISGHSGWTTLLNGTFGTFTHYIDKSYMDSHETVILMTPEKSYILRVDAAEVIRGSKLAKRTSFRDIDDLNEWRDKRFADSKTLSDSRLRRVDQMVTFVTCSYDFWPSNERTLVMCSRLQPIALIDKIDDLERA